MALRGAALLTRLLLDTLDSKAPPPGLLQAAGMLHDNALLVRSWHCIPCMAQPENEEHVKLCYRAKHQRCFVQRKMQQTAVMPRSARMLNQTLPGWSQLAPESPALQEAVSQLCCAVWLAKVEGRECVVAQTLPHLVIRALTTGGAAAAQADMHGRRNPNETSSQSNAVTWTVPDPLHRHTSHMRVLLAAAEVRADVKRCNAVRDALELLDWDDASTADTKRYLLRSAFSPAFLRVPEGRRFVAFLMTLHPQMVHP